MLLNLLEREEKFYFLHLLRKLVLVDGETNDFEKQIVKKLKYEMGDDVLKYRASHKTLEQLLKYFEDKPQAIKNVIFMNLYSASLEDEWYNVAQHLLLDNIQKSLNVTKDKKIKLLKLVYDERDLKERAKRVISQ